MAMPQTPLLSMDDDSLYQLVSQVPERLAAKLTRGIRVMVRLDSLNTTLPATIVEIVPSADPSSRTLTVKANLPHAAGVQSGLFGRLALSIGTETAIMAPASAVLDRNGLTGVYVVDEAGTAQFTLVTLGKRSGERVQILSGLQDGQHIVTSPVDHITAGQRIRAEEGAL
jgi:RND family efflux transporter MFP subunit